MIKTAIIEDSKAIANVYKSYLNNTEFKVNIFGSDVDEIENLVKESGFEIIIYPSYPKFQRACKIISRIKSDTQLASAIFILATTMQKSTLKSELNFKDIDGMIVKPFQQQELYQSLSNSYYSHSRFTRKNPVAVVVDDSKAAQRVIATALTALNFIVKTASDGAEGLKLALKILPDLILTDVEMPVMDGFELCRKISLETSIQNTPVIVISGNIDDAQFRKGFKSGAIDFLKKPVSQADLFSVIESVSFQNLTIPSGTALVASQDQTLCG
ncbi:MAG: response regulator, partial [Thermodesulfobacteriota bacterium]|nr:response regulator [Thermodesulfobacteriota bacterium]